MAPHPDNTPSSTEDHHRKEAEPTPMPTNVHYEPPPNPYTTGALTPIVEINSNGNPIVIFFDAMSNPHTYTYTGTSIGVYPPYVPTSTTSTTSILAVAETTVSPSRYLTTSTTSSQVGHGTQTGAYPDGPDNYDHHGPAFPAIAALGIIVPTILIMLSLCGFFFCIRPKLRRRAGQQPDGAGIEAAPHAEMKHVAVGVGPNEHIQRAVGITTASSAIVPPSTSPNASSSSSTGTPPVILSTTMNNTYYTGIDTSDHISLTDQRSEASADTFGDEPPPPYRPRSVPPISREASVRNSICRNTSVRSNRHEGSNLIGVRRSADVRSPFDDPEDSDDDVISQRSTIRSLPRHHDDTDRLSAVSDLSYQEEPATTHSTV